MRLNRISLVTCLSLAVFLSASCLFAQGPDNTTRVNDPSFLRPPAGAKVAVIEFADQECPMCAHFAPIVHADIERYRVPFLRYDYPLPMHTWAYNAALDARWFDLHSQALGDEYRLRVFANQAAISSPNDLLGFTQRFAREKGLAWPFLIDPQGQLRAKVDHDIALGKTKVIIDHTPTVWVVTRSHYVEIKSAEDLDPAIRRALAETSGR